MYLFEKINIKYVYWGEYVGSYYKFTCTKPPYYGLQPTIFSKNLVISTSGSDKETFSFC